MIISHLDVLFEDVLPFGGDRTTSRRAVGDWPEYIIIGTLQRHLGRGAGALGVTCKRRGGHNHGYGCQDYRSDIFLHTFLDTTPAQTGLVITFPCRLVRAEDLCWVHLDTESAKLGCGIAVQSSGAKVVVVAFGERTGWASTLSNCKQAALLIQSTLAVQVGIQANTLNAGGYSATDVPSRETTERVRMSV